MNPGAFGGLGGRGLGGTGGRRSRRLRAARRGAAEDRGGDRRRLLRAHVAATICRRRSRASPTSSTISTRSGSRPKSSTARCTTSRCISRMPDLTARARKRYLASKAPGGGVRNPFVHTELTRPSHQYYRRSLSSPLSRCFPAPEVDDDSTRSARSTIRWCALRPVAGPSPAGLRRPPARADELGHGHHRRHGPRPRRQGRRQRRGRGPQHARATSAPRSTDGGGRFVVDLPDRRAPTTSKCRCRASTTSRRDGVQVSAGKPIDVTFSLTRRQHHRDGDRVGGAAGGAAVARRRRGR